MPVTGDVAGELPVGWEKTSDRNGPVFVSPDSVEGHSQTVRWWGAHHSGLYVEGYDFAVVVPLAVVAAVLDSVGFIVTRKQGA